MCGFGGELVASLARRGPPFCGDGAGETGARRFGRRVGGSLGEVKEVRGGVVCVLEGVRGVGVQGSPGGRGVPLDDGACGRLPTVRCAGDRVRQAS